MSFLQGWIKGKMTIMNRRTIKFLVGSLIIVGAIVWLGFSGFNESLAYYKTVDELKLMKGDAFNKRLQSGRKCCQWKH